LWIFLKDLVMFRLLKNICYSLIKSTASQKLTVR
jgi:hypothetical protein